MESPQPPRLLDQVRQAIRVRHYSLKTEKSYVYYIRDYILFHNKRHPKDMGADEIRNYLSYLAVNQNVASSTQNVALSALLFLYRDVLQIELLK
jgi:site-specific recombinase XerD